MLGAYVIAIVLGLATGLRYKVPALAAGSLVIIFVGTGAALFGVGGLEWGFLHTLAAMLLFQCGYLFGLSLTCALARIFVWLRSMRSTARPPEVLAHTHAPRR